MDIDYYSVLAKAVTGKDQAARDKIYRDAWELIRNSPNLTRESAAAYTAALEDAVRRIEDDIAAEDNTVPEEAKSASATNEVLSTGRNWKPLIFGACALVTAFLSGQIADYSVAGHRQQLSGNQAVSRKPTANLFRAGEGYLLLAVNNEKQYRALMAAIGREDVLKDPRFPDWFARQENEPALRAIIEEALAKRSPREWEKVLDAAGAPCASIWKIEEVIDHPQIAARGAVQKLDTPYGRLRFAGSGFRLAHGGGKLDRMAPEPGANTDEVLASIGYDARAIADLRAAEVV